MQFIKTLPPALKKLISIAFFAGLVFLGARTCSVETASTEIVFRLGESISAPGELPRELEVRLYEREGTELMGSFRKYYQDQQAGPDARWPLSISAGTYRLEGELETNQRVRSFTREVSLQDDEVVTVSIDRYFSDQP